MKDQRIHKLNLKTTIKGPVIYWMSRDQRIEFNHALSFAQSRALDLKTPLIVVFNLVPEFINATLRQYSFMIDGLKKLERELNNYNINFVILTGEPQKEILNFINKAKAGMLVSDFSPLNIKQKWNEQILKEINIPFYEIDTHNIVPCKLVSNKREYAAYTIRPKINKLLDNFLYDIPEKIQKHPYQADLNLKKHINWEILINNLKINRSIKPVTCLKSGGSNANEVLQVFISNKLANYSKHKNDPTKKVLSDLSPYLHFGQISSQEIAIKVKNCNSNEESKNVFLEELIVRKELSDNFCYYCKDYDNFNGLSNWAKETLKKHSNDERKHVYNLNQFENLKTHDKLWNAAQRELIITGKMHGYMRMYWAKKILEWSVSPKEAINISLYLNNKYALDGNDPNSYTGILWSIGGLHDRAWKERSVFGKIRYMNYNGCKNKFNVETYIENINALI